MKFKNNNINFLKKNINVDKIDADLKNEKERNLTKTKKYN
jgi:hypothetical protein